MFEDMVATHEVKAGIGKRQLFTVHTLLEKFRHWRYFAQQIAFRTDQVHDRYASKTGLLFLLQSFGDIKEELPFATTDVQHAQLSFVFFIPFKPPLESRRSRSEEHTSELQSLRHL